MSLSPDPRRRWRIIGAAMAFLGAFPALLAGLVFGLADGSVVEGLAITVLSLTMFWPALLVGVLLRARVLDTGSWVASRARVGTIVVLCLVQGACWIGTTSVSAPSPDDRYFYAMSTDLKIHASDQMLYYDEHRSYTGNLADLAFSNSDGVVIELDGSDVGWTARSTHAALDGESCTMYYGDVSTPMGTLGGLTPTVAGEVVCGSPTPFESQGWLGDLLRDYYQALDRRWNR